MCCKHRCLICLNYLGVDRINSFSVRRLEPQRHGAELKKGLIHNLVSGKLDGSWYLSLGFHSF